MRTEVIKADTIDVAVEGILNELNRSRQNVIYFDGWDGLGASAVLRAVAQRLASKELMRPPGLEFDQVIHIDCSKWESTRAVQREIAEQLKLPTEVIEMFVKQDEEDDFNGIIDQGSRMEIAEVTSEIQRSIEGRRFLLVLHNGSNVEVDIAGLGLSVYGYLKSKMLWTFQGRFRMDPRMKGMAMMKNTTDAIFSASCFVRDPHELWSYLVREEAAQVASKIGIDPAMVVKCFLYMLTHRCTSCHHVNNDYDLATHVCNYWICDGIITEDTDLNEAWKVGEALQGEIRLDVDYHNELPTHLLRYADSIPHWSSPAYGFFLVPHGVVPCGTSFQHFDKLGVIKLSRCRFSFSSPPFLCCNLRCLCLDHCQDLRSTEGEQREEDTIRSSACFQSLLVLDLRYTDWEHILSAQVMDLMIQLRELDVMGAKNWDMSHLRGRLHNIRKLRVKKSTCCFKNNVFSEMKNMELLDFSGNTIRQGLKSLYGAGINSSLKTVIIDGCDGLEVISFRDCKDLKNLFLKGLLGNLEKLDLSGTKVKTLDLEGVQSTLPNQIFLLRCEKLLAILWPESLKEKKWPDVLRIETTSTSASTEGGEIAHAHPYDDLSLQKQKKEFLARWQISLTDARLLRSLFPVRGYLSPESLILRLHIDICSSTVLGGSNVQGTNNDKLVQVQPHTGTTMDSEYRDILKHSPVEVIVMWDCPEIHSLQYDYIRYIIIKLIMQGQGNRLLGDAPSVSTSALLFPDFICEVATSLHVYDNLSITSIPTPPQESGWKELRWCRVERCPKLLTVFTVPEDRCVDSFKNLHTLWVSQLLTARYILDRTFFISDISFIHLDCCPRLLHAFPTGISFHYYLGTLEIVYCGDLREVFPVSPELQKQDRVIEFPYLKHIHLHELPMLHRICGCRMSTRKLKTIKIRGCWSLRRLPDVEKYTKPPKVDSEKEWWDNLEWDGVENHQPSRYEPSHSLYYKAQLPRVSVLR